MNIYDSWLVQMPIAHRGLFNDKYPENSLGAFRNAIKNKIPIEFDVTSLADGTLVVFHDEKLARMTGKDGYISHCNYSDISKLTLKETKEKIPTLKEVLDLIDGKVPIVVEIKNFGKVGVIEKNVWKLLQEYKGEYVVQSFNPYSLEWFKKNAPKIKRGQLASFFSDREITGIRRFTLKRMMLNKKISEPHFINYDAKDMPNKYIKKYYGVIPILTWVINSPEEEERVKPLSDNIVFDSYIPEKYKDVIK